MADMQDQKGVGKRLLVAEDNAINLLVVTLMLESSGYAFDAVENGLDCIKLLGENSYDLVLTDISMPLMDGIQVATTIRATTDARCRIPIIVMTANAELSEAERYAAAGINDVLAKPFGKADLLRCVNKWL
jgi:CheY-like chemotaxis protein